MSDGTGAMDSLLHEGRRFPPPEGFRDRAVVSDGAVYDEARADPEAYWARWARELDWY
jgi:acetyl-CoA synthetase